MEDFAIADIDKVIIDSFYFENLTIQEIADENGVSKNAVSKCILNIKH